MAKHMKLWVAGSLLLAIGGTVVVASNMGFKFVPNIPLANPNTYTVSLPLNNNYTTADSVFDDVAASGGGCGNVSLVRRRNSDGTVDDWSGTSGTNFTLSKGAGLQVQLSAGSCTSWVIVGSHDPSFAYVLSGGNPLTFFESIPYHTTATIADNLFDEVTNCNFVRRHNASGTVDDWSGTSGLNFPVVIGEAYSFQTTTGSPSVNWTPAHY